MSFARFAFASILILIWVITGGFATQANVFLQDYKGSDNQMKQAYWLTFGVAFITWFLIGLAIVIVCVMFFSGAGEAEVAEGGAEAGEEAEASEAEASEEKEGESETGKGQKNSMLINIFFATAFLLVLTTGLLSTFAAAAIAKSPNYKSSISKLKKAYTNCIISAVLSMGSVGFLIIGYIVMKVMKNKKEKKRMESEQRGRGMPQRGRPEPHGEERMPQRQSYGEERMPQRQSYGSPRQSYGSRYSE